VPKTTPAQTFRAIFNMWVHKNTPQKERDTAERKMDAWLKKHGKTRADISTIIVQAAADDDAARSPLPPSDPRDDAPHPFDNPKYTPISLVEGVVAKYVTMRPHLLTVFAAYICFSHVYRKFNIAPRLAFVSDDPDSGKTTALNVGSHLVLRPNPEALGTAAAIREYIDEGPGTVMLDDLDQVDPEAAQALLKIWNLGHSMRKGKIALLIRGKRKVFDLYAPMIAAGIGNFMKQAQMSRVFKIRMEPYDDKTRPNCDYNASEDADLDDLDKVYSFLRNWAARVKLNVKPSMPPELLRRAGDNVRGLISVADSCGPEWGQRVREALMKLYKDDQAERPQITMIKHGLAIFEALEPNEMIKSTRFNQDLKHLDMPDARWTQYRGPSSSDYPHPIEMHEQAALLKKVGIESMRIRLPGEKKQSRGYVRAQFEEALKKHGPTPDEDEDKPARGRLRLITPSSD
jgi:hypothetical protein